MTRISSSIPPKQLCDQMLIAEHREIIRVPNMIKSGRAKIQDLPTSFTLGKGHVKFFYDKVLYLKKRYNALRQECLNRGFNVQDFSNSFSNIPQHLLNDYIIEPHVNQIVKDRINERLSNMKNIRYWGQNINYNQIKL